MQVTSWQLGKLTNFTTSLLQMSGRVSIRVVSNRKKIKNFDKRMDKVYNSSIINSPITVRGDLYIIVLCTLKSKNCHITGAFLVFEESWNQFDPSFFFFFEKLENVQLLTQSII